MNIKALTIATTLIEQSTETDSGCFIPKYKTLTNEEGNRESSRVFAHRVLSETGHTKNISLYNSCLNNECCNPDHLYQPDDKQAFMRRVKIQPTGCWHFSTLAPNGYGVYDDPAQQGKSVLAHRHSYKLFKGEIPAGMKILHSCDEKSCVCPGHLSCGSSKQNSEDMVRKGRSTKGRKKPVKRFTPEEKTAIVNLSLSGLSNYQIAKKYKRCGPTISQVLRKHKPKPKAPQPTPIILETVHAEAA